MAALQKIHGWAGFDEQQYLGGLVDTEEIRNRPLDAVVEKLEAFTVQAADELASRVGDDDSDVDAIHTDANAGRWLGGLLWRSGWHKQETAREKKSRAPSRGKEHAPIRHRKMPTRKTKVLFRLKFPEGGTGLATTGGIASLS
jgi:hypothetical protein